MQEPETTSGSPPKLSTESLAHIGRGLLIGGADVVPGVSGGTVALILGIYARLVTAISHVDATLFAHLRRRNWRAAAEHLDLRLLIPLGIGIVAGIAALGTVMHVLLERHMQSTLAAFFGMILASCLIVGRMVPRWSAREMVLFLVGAISAWWLVSRPALEQPPEGLWYLFLCGFLGICAMILPGISGAFILLIMGKYHELTGIIKQTMHLQISVESILVVLVFCSGCLIGLLTFSKLLRWLLKTHGAATMAVLCGFMAGSLRRIWPFQRDATPEVSEFKEKLFEPIPPFELSLDASFWATLGIAVVACLLILLLDRLSATATPANWENESSP